METSILLSISMSIITIGIQKSIITSLILHLFIYSLIQQRLILQTPFTAWLGKLVPQRLKVNEVKLNQKWEMEREGRSQEENKNSYLRITYKPTALVISQQANRSDWIEKGYMF